MGGIGQQLLKGDGWAFRNIRTMLVLGVGELISLVLSYPLWILGLVEIWRAQYPGMAEDKLYRVIPLTEKEWNTL